MIFKIYSISIREMEAILNFGLSLIKYTLFVSIGGVAVGGWYLYTTKPKEESFTIGKGLFADIAIKTVPKTFKDYVFFRICDINNMHFIGICNNWREIR